MSTIRMKQFVVNEAQKHFNIPKTNIRLQISTTEITKKCRRKDGFNCADKGTEH